MKLKLSDLQIISYWWTKTLIKDNVTTDVIYLQLKNLDFEISYMFPRYKSYCYIETLKDYAPKYSSNVEFVELYKQLLKKIPRVIKNDEAPSRLTCHNRERQSII
jgi:hypothetical protein